MKVGAILMLLMFNMLSGGFILHCFDNDDGRLFKWWLRCPLPVFGHLLTLTCWPVIVYWYLKTDRVKAKKDKAM